MFENLISILTIMACRISCIISAVFIIGMIYFYNTTSEVVKRYKKELSPELQQRYEKIAKERMTISYYGYGLGLFFSLFILFCLKRVRSFSLVCTVMATCFLTNYFYYMLSPKSDWMLNHLYTPEQVKAWLQMYREMSYRYHMGIVLGIIGVGIFAFAFRC